MKLDYPSSRPHIGVSYKKCDVTKREDLNRSSQKQMKPRTPSSNCEGNFSERVVQGATCREPSRKPSCKHSWEAAREPTDRDGDSHNRRILKLSCLVASGRYHISSGAVADAMIERMICDGAEILGVVDQSQSSTHSRAGAQRLISS